MLCKIIKYILSDKTISNQQAKNCSLINVSFKSNKIFCIRIFTFSNFLLNILNLIMINPVS